MCEFKRKDTSKDLETVNKIKELLEAQQIAPVDECNCCCVYSCGYGCPYIIHPEVLSFSESMQHKVCFICWENWTLNNNHQYYVNLDQARFVNASLPIVSTASWKLDYINDIRLSFLQLHESSLPQLLPHRAILTFQLQPNGYNFSIKTGLSLRGRSSNW